MSSSLLFLESFSALKSKHKHGAVISPLISSPNICLEHPSGEVNASSYINIHLHVLFIRFSRPSGFIQLAEVIHICRPDRNHFNIHLSWAQINV